MVRLPKPEARRRVGIWIRVSTDDQARGESPEHHEKRAKSYAESKDWDVVEVYHLEGVSGKSVLKHPEAQRMLADIRSGAITALIFSKIARLARNTRELLDFADEFEKHEADLVSLQESIDTSTPAGRMFYTMMAALAEWERAEISSRVAASVPIRAKLGKTLGGAAPYGYAWENQRLVVDEREAPIRRLMFELFAEHRKKGAVARLITQAGHRSRKGYKFRPSGIERLITDPLAKGTRRMNYRASPGAGAVFKKPSDWIYVEAPPIVSEELWEHCNAILRGQKQPGATPKKGATHLFTGVLVCHCGTKMYVQTKTTSYICAECRNKVGEEDLELVFIEQLRGYVMSPEQVATNLEQADRELVGKQEVLASLETEQAGVASEMEKLYRLYQADRISDQLFGERNDPLEERLRQLQDEVPKLQGELDYLRLQIRSSNEVLSEARDLYSRWPTLSFEDRRQIIESITDRITVSGNEISIQLAYLPESEKPPPKAKQMLPKPLLIGCQTTAVAEGAGRRRQINRN